MNRGSVWGTRSAAGTAAGFNEAPIHESGKSPASSSASEAKAGFNEAPIHESGKFTIPDILELDVSALQ